MTLDNFTPRSFAGSGIGLAGIAARDGGGNIISDELNSNAITAIDRYFVFFVEPSNGLLHYPSTDPGIWRDKPDLRQNAPASGVTWDAFIGGVTQPIDFMIKPFQTKTGGRYLNGARRIIGLDKPFVEGSVRVRAGKASSVNALLEMANRTGEGAWMWIGNVAATGEIAAGLASTPITDKASRAAVETWAQWPFGLGATAYEAIDWSKEKYRLHQAFAASFIFVSSFWITRHKPIMGNQSIDFAVDVRLNFSTAWNGRVIGSR